ncbi:hypothetical protein, conserved, partial [Trypanosoma cruzi]
MPVRVFVTLPPADGPAVTEEVLAQQVMQEFMAMRHAGSSVELLCSVSSARLQQTIAERYPLAYNRLLLEGRWRGKWHFFAEEIVGLRCFLYTLRDYAETRDLEVHVAFSELRCCVKDEDARAVRQADGSVGALLREHLLQKDALHRWCDEAVKAAQADGGAGGADRALWRAPPPAPAPDEAREAVAFLRVRGWKFWVASAPRREGGCSDHDGERHACAAHECTAAPPSRRPLSSIVGAGELRQAIREGPLHGGHGVRSEGRGGRGATRCGKGAGCCGRTSLSSLQ